MRRLELRKTRKQCAKEFGISVKTLWGWETNRWQPIGPHRAKLEKILGVAECSVRKGIIEGEEGG